jgi:hypothetical protein
VIIMKDRNNKTAPTRRKFLQVAGAVSIISLSEAVSASGSQETENPSAENDNLPDISVRNTRQKKEPVVVKFINTSEGNERGKTVGERTFSVPGRGSEKSRVTDSLELDPGSYTVEVKVGRSEQEPTATKSWGVPPGGVADYQSLVVRVPPERAPLISSIEA